MERGIRMNSKKIDGEILYGAGDSIHRILFNADVDSANEEVGNMELEIAPGFLDDILHDVFKESESEALRLANI